MAEVGRPSGTVTFLFTDVEGSTALWSTAPEAMSKALALHDRVLREVFEDHGGSVFATGGDGLAVAFSRVQDAVAAAGEAQDAMDSARWPEGAPLRVRMGLHVGEVEERGGDYFGPEVNRAARIMDAGHGGQVLASTAIVEIAGGDGFVPLGHHRLRGFGSPDELWQLGEGSFPSLRSLRQAGTLPNPATSFVGRGAELADVAALLGEARLVTLVGVGGVGKTRLALEAARRAADRFADGVWFVDLSARGDPEVVVEAVAASIGAAPQGETSTVDSLMGYLAERRLLIVLDNCEHLLDGVAGLCVDVLAGADGVTMLATSREPIGVAGERIWSTPSLTQGSALFVERATESQAGFDPSVDDLEEVATICDRLDGIPLAIELAAARTRSMTVIEIRDALDNRFRLLRGSGRGGTERHQTLQATVQWSLDLLDSFDRHLFECLGVFPASFDLGAAEAVCGSVMDADEWDLRDGLDRLVDRSLLTARRVGDSTRYRLLETFRQYGQQLLDVATATDLRRAHLGHFTEVALAEGIEFLNFIPTSEPERWDMERDNILAAMQWALANEDHQACAALARAAHDHLLWQPELEMNEWALEAAAHGEALADTAAAASVAATHFGGGYEEGVKLARHALELDATNPRAWINLFTSLSLWDGPSAEAIEAGTTTVRLLPDEEHMWRGAIQGHRASLLLTVDTAAAADSASESEQILAAHRSARAAPVLRTTLARYALTTGDVDRAIELAEEALTAMSSHDGGSVWAGALRIRAEAAARKSGADSEPVFHDALDQLAEAHIWGHVWLLMDPLTRMWIDTGKIEAAATVIGYLDANSVKIPNLEQLMQSVADAGTPQAAQRGQAMNRTELLEYVLAELMPAARGGLLDPHANPNQPDLTDRQLEVAQLVARGLSNKDIAKRLDVSPYTVETHVRNILERLDANSRTQIVAWVKDNDI